MKKTITSIAALLLLIFCSYAQSSYKDRMMKVTASLEQAKTAKEFEKLAAQFETLSTSPEADWLAPYYAAYCNAKIGWLYQHDGDKIEPFANKAEKQIQTALSYLDSSEQKKEMSEVYTVLSMINRARVFINPMTYGPTNGPTAMQYYQKALQANESNPRANWLNGWDKFYTPKMFGGDRIKAKEILTNALAQWQNEKPGENYPHWGKTEIETLLQQLK